LKKVKNKMLAQEILFFSHGVKVKTLHKEILKDWLLKTAEIHHSKIESISIIFCSDDYLRRINNQFLKHDYYTDIVTFHYENNDEPIVGELYISIDMVRENAKKFKEKTENEKRRVIIHGLLHLLGYKDEKLEEKQKMNCLEDKYLLVLKKMLSTSST
jgi:probable rRNA maturation factor